MNGIAGDSLAQVTVRVKMHMSVLKCEREGATQKTVCTGASLYRREVGD